MELEEDELEDIDNTFEETMEAAAAARADVEDADGDLTDEAEEEAVLVTDGEEE